ncbi:ferredoxin reductase family protein [Rhodocyclus tenuis]|nr:ferric reductase-like transmembrane domain-containing protein [Rhodocyclus tenuis]
MKNIKIIYMAILGGLAALWLLADPVWSAPYEFFTLRAALVNLSGIVGIALMSVGMMLALRPVSIEPFVGGLDKTYRLHKWLGITGLVFSIIHWLLAKGPKWAVGWGWLERPVHGPAAEQPVAIFRFFSSQKDLAEALGEWTFYALLLLLALALLKQFPYRYFFKTHRLLALVYLLLVAHSLILMKFSYWGELLGPVLALLMAGGTIAAGVSLLRRVGYRHRAVGVIESVFLHSDNRVLRVAIKLKDRWPGHQAGQFAFVTFDRDEGPHPFTISSSWDGDGRMFFLIKGLGDYTNFLPEMLQPGDLLQVEGPYGQFEFNSGKLQQIWIAGGIGITPFIARMQALADHADGKRVDLFYCTREPDEGFINRLRLHALAAGVRLHVRVDAVDGRLDAQGLIDAVPDWCSADIWFCGPAGFGQSVRSALLGRGFAGADFHQELFAMR